MVSMTIRMWEEEEAAIQGLANHMDCTRQEIDTGLAANPTGGCRGICSGDGATRLQCHRYSREELLPPEYNKANSVEDHQMMLEEQIAA